MSEYCKNCFEFAEKLTEKEQECEQYKKRAVYFKDVNKQLGYKYLTIKQECEQIKEKYEALKLENEEGYEIVDELKHEYEELENKIKELEEKLLRKEQECEELKKQLMQKSEVDMFFNTPIEGWSNDPCGICPHKAENEELKKEIINKNEKIKELRFSVSDLTNRFCSLNAEKSFRIVDLEQTLDEFELLITNHISSCEKCPDNKNGYCIGIDECSSRCLKKILDIISKAKDGE